jgi:signal transduction histidine kinase
VTEAEGRDLGSWGPVLREVARTSGHELRNSLNALVVNLEVVRSRALGNAGLSTFIDQAVEQSEESVRLAEGAIALLNLIVSAMSEVGESRIRSEGPQKARIEASEAEADRVVKSLATLIGRTAITAESSDAAVILSIPAEAATQPIEERE